MKAQKIVVIGAGIGGLTAAALLSHAGLDVTVCEAAPTPGGKLREVTAGDARIDAGPTVFTLRPVFEEIFAQAGSSLDAHLTLEPLDTLARHAWEDGARLDLFADAARNAAAIGDFAGAEAARGYTLFAARSRKIFETLDAPFMRAQAPGLLGLARNAGVKQTPNLMNLSAFASLWDELAKYFKNPRLRQLFARYSTYCGSSPFTSPATLMLIAHAEQMGVWRIKGGMFRLAEALAACATANGAAFLYNTKVTEIQSANGRTAGVRLDHGETLAADAVIANADLAALDAGYFGAAAKAAVAGMLKGAAPSLSAVTWVCTGTASGFPLAHHNVFFANNYPAEFVAISNGRLPPDPTVYLCAPEPGRFFCLINAPAGADTSLAPAGADKNREEDECLSHVLKKLQRCGLNLRPEAITRTGPQEFGRLFPASRGALYGRALEGWRDSFARPGARTKLPGLYLAGGAIHPGPGLPMAALSGRLAAARLLDQYGFGSNRHIRSKPMKLIASTKS